MEKKDTNVKKSKKVKRAKSKGTFAKILLVVLILALIGIMSLLFLLYGPWSGFRDWLITTAMSSMRHQYLATWFYDDKTIPEALSTRWDWTHEEWGRNVRGEINRILKVKKVILDAPRMSKL